MKMIEESDTDDNEEDVVKTVSHIPRIVVCESSCIASRCHASVPAATNAGGAAMTPIRGTRISFIHEKSAHADTDAHTHRSRADDPHRVIAVLCCVLHACTASMLHMLGMHTGRRRLAVEPPTDGPFFRRTGGVAASPKTKVFGDRSRAGGISGLADSASRPPARLRARLGCLHPSIRA